jgi:hypothetical protein
VSAFEAAAVGPDFAAVNTTTLARVVGALLTVVLIAAVAALVTAAVMWAWGSHNGNYQLAARGKAGVLVALGAAAAAGAAAGWCNFLIHLGDKI